MREPTGIGVHTGQRVYGAFCRLEVNGGTRHGYRPYVVSRSAALCASILSLLALTPWMAFIYNAWPRTKATPSLAHKSASRYQVKIHCTPMTTSSRYGAIALRATGWDVTPGLCLSGCDALEPGSTSPAHAPDAKTGRIALQMCKTRTANIICRKSARRSYTRPIGRVWLSVSKMWRPLIKRGRIVYRTLGQAT